MNKQRNTTYALVLLLILTSVTTTVGAVCDGSIKLVVKRESHDYQDPKVTSGTNFIPTCMLCSQAFASGFKVKFLYHCAHCDKSLYNGSVGSIWMHLCGGCRHKSRVAGFMPFSIFTGFSYDIKSVARSLLREHLEDTPTCNTAAQLGPSTPLLSPAGETWELHEYPKQATLGGCPCCALL